MNPEIEKKFDELIALLKAEEKKHLEAENGWSRTPISTLFEINAKQLEGFKNSLLVAVKTFTYYP